MKQTLVELKTFDSEDKTLIKEYKNQLAQAKRNIEQGEMGRALAESKITAIKANL